MEEHPIPMKTSPRQMKLLLYATIILLVAVLIAMFFYTQDVVALRQEIADKGCRALCERCFNSTYFGDLNFTV